MTKSFENAQSPLVCPVRARLASQWRAACENEAEGVARAERNLACASLSEYPTIVATSERLKRETEEAMIALRDHRQSHGC